jgi:DNA-binding GntR family transcriptional regulator
MRKNVCDVLRDRIVNLYYKPGDTLNEKRLADEFQVSRTPVREALIRLSGERLVTIIPHVGARASEINLQDFQEIIELREVLERGVARLVARNITEEQIRQIEELHAAIRRDGGENIGQLISYDMQFHRILTGASRNNRLGEALSIIQNQFFRIQRMISHRPERMSADMPKLIKTLKKRDSVQLEKLLMDHVENFVKAVRRCFKIEK